MFSGQYWLSGMASAVLSSTALHYVGEKLAYGLGITSPDWQYAIDLYDTLKQEEEEEKREEEQAIREEQERRLERLRQLESTGT